MEDWKGSVAVDPKRVGDIETRNLMCRECDLKARPGWEAVMVDRLHFMDMESVPPGSPLWLVAAMSFLKARRSAF